MIPATSRQPGVADWSQDPHKLRQKQQGCPKPASRNALWIPAAAYPGAVAIRYCAISASVIQCMSSGGAASRVNQ